MPGMAHDADRPRVDTRIGIQCVHRGRKTVGPRHQGGGRVHRPAQRRHGLRRLLLAVRDEIRGIEARIGEPCIEVPLDRRQRDIAAEDLGRGPAGEAFHHAAIADLTVCIGEGLVRKDGACVGKGLADHHGHRA